MKKLNEQFDPNENEDFTNAAYILQLDENGQYSAFKDFIKEIDTNDLLHLLSVFYLREAFNEQIKEEIKNRVVGGSV